MGGIFSSAEEAPPRYFGKWVHTKKGTGKAITTKTLIIQAAGTIRSMGTVTDEEGNTTMYDTGDIPCVGWAKEGASVVSGGFVSGISKKLHVTPLGHLHVTTDEAAETMCAGNRLELITETYRKNN